MIKLLTGIPKAGRSAIYNKLTGWSRLVLLPKFRQGVDPKIQYVMADKNQKWPTLYNEPPSFRGEN